MLTAVASYLWDHNSEESGGTELSCASGLALHISGIWDSGLDGKHGRKIASEDTHFLPLSLLPKIYSANYIETTF